MRRVRQIRRRRRRHDGLVQLRMLALPLMAFAAPWQTFSFAHVAALVAWLTVGLWMSRVLPALFSLRRVPDLCRLPQEAVPAGMPLLTVVVPAKEEERYIEATLRSLLQQDYLAMGTALQIVAVNDRSVDGTGAVMERIAAAFPDVVRVLHVADLPPGWTGKVHAMARGAALAQGEYVLFTDADILFAPDALRRALVVAVRERADHMVVMPTPIVRSWREGALLGAFQLFGLLAVRPWKVADPKAKRDAMGVGAFNLVRRAAFERMGGFDGMRMEVLEDVRLGFEFKRAGLRSRVAFGRGLVQVHWAHGARGLVGVLTKNLFAAMRFNVAVTLLSCGLLVVVCVLPAAELFYAPTRWAGLVSWLLVGLGYRLYRGYSGIGVRFALLFPLGSAAMIFAVLRSMAVSLRQGGVLWRGTFYPLRELRRNLGQPFWR